MKKCTIDATPDNLKQVHDCRAEVKTYIKHYQGNFKDWDLDYQNVIENRKKALNKFKNSEYE